ncbi:MAG: V-type ATP synthase subunit I [Bacillota bacterium]|nr:V-type ATP synthase subunit I [Bacillota bacterium]
MAVVKMNKIAILGLEKERTRLMESLMEMGVVQISESTVDEESPGITIPQNHSELARLDHMLSELSASLEVLRRYVPVKKPLFSVRRVISRKVFESVLGSSQTIMETAREINSCEGHIAAINSEDNRQHTLLTSLDMWMDLDVPLNISSTRTTAIVMGTLPQSVDLNELVKALDDEVGAASLVCSGSDRDHHYILLIVHKTREQEGLALLKDRGFSRMDFKDMDGTPRQNRERILKAREELFRQREEYINRIRQLSEGRDEIETLYDALLMERERAEAFGKLLTTRSVFLLKGWLPAEFSDKLKNWLEENFLCSVQITEPDPDEETPVLIQNGSVTESIKPVIDMYGVPSSREIDPSGTTMFFFIFFFGMIVADAGYGLILALAGGLALKLFRMEEGTRRFMKLVFFSGLTTIFWGAMFGGYFGIEALSKYALWFNPGEEGGTERLMVYCLLFGIIHLYAGHAMKALNLIRRRQYLETVFDVLFPVIMYTGFAMAILPNVPGIDPHMAAKISSYGVYVLLVGIILTVFTAGRNNRNVIGKVFGGFPKLYDIIGFLGDVLSYMRLMALSLSGGILSGLINGMAGGGGIIFKLTGGLMLLVLGHGINFAMSILGGFVNSCRLQYLEYFSKFLEGGGEAFHPLKAKTRYILVKQEDETLWRQI